MRFTNILKFLFERVLGWILCAIFIFMIVFLIGCLIYFNDIKEGAPSPITLCILPAILWAIVYAFNVLITIYVFNAKVYNSGWVSNGKSLMTFEKTPGYYKRSMVGNFIACGIYIACVITLIVMFKRFDLTFFIIDLIISVAGMIFTFMLGMSAKEHIKETSIIRHDDL